MWTSDYFGNDGYPIPAFYFKVIFVNPLNGADTSFQSVSGLSSEVKYKEIQEGGGNEGSYSLPETVTHSPLVLKRGISSVNSGLFLWLNAVMQTDFRFPVYPRMLQIHLLDPQGWPNKVWQIDDALPKKWSVDEFNSTGDKVAIETVELKYTKSSRLF
ncbi:phage tail protein [Teredinibacter haidensis]|uniref:phage tail protein n=1 Tax=Teredinibacter haidensis TaxID=2731755 RepID=UPI0009490FDD|nr:phage tail protein [Teredinibacter haidensis]